MMPTIERGKVTTSAKYSDQFLVKLGISGTLARLFGHPMALMVHP